MARYRVMRDTWISHENRVAVAGSELATDFPLVGGKPMRLGDNLVLIEEEVEAEAPASKPKKAAKAESTDLA